VPGSDPSSRRHDGAKLKWRHACICPNEDETARVVHPFLMGVSLMPGSWQSVLQVTVTPTFYNNKNFVQIGLHIKMHIKL
jgi:hypothetical protein